MQWKYNAINFPISDTTHFHILSFSNSWITYLHVDSSFLVTTRIIEQVGGWHIGQWWYIWKHVESLIVQINCIIFSVIVQII